MKKLKFIIVGLLSATLLLGACGNDEEEKTKDNKTELKQEKPTTDKGKI